MNTIDGANLFIKRIYNVIKVHGWSFKLVNFNLSTRVLRAGQSLTVHGNVKNDGIRTGSVYIQVLIANPYNHKEVVFDSNKHFSSNTKRSLRIVDVEKNETEAFACTWFIPENTRSSVYDIKIIVWNPPKLFEEKYTWAFDESKWHGGLEILDKSSAGFDKTIFISYTWLNIKHQEWVQRLYEELIKLEYNVCFDKQYLKPGEEITHYMERMMTFADAILLICSDEYTSRANKRIGGVGYETVISTSMYLSESNKSKFIPILRDNESGEIPTFLGSTLYIDMNERNWKGLPLQLLHSKLSEI